MKDICEYNVCIEDRSSMMEYTGYEHCECCSDGLLAMKNLSEYQFDFRPYGLSNFEFILKGKVDVLHKDNLKMKVLVDGKEISEVQFGSDVGAFLEGQFLLSSSALSKLHNNHISLKLETDCPGILFFLKSIEKKIKSPPQDWDASTWMSKLSDDDNISMINIPGSHDCAAIRSMSAITTPYACHSRNISEQLESGIRLLDVRLSIRQKNEKLVIITCHGALGQTLKLNEYQSFESLIDECREFLKENTKEFLVMTLKIDSLQSEYKEKKIEVAKIIDEALGGNNKNLFIRESSLPKVSKARGKIVLLSRIEEELQETEYNFGPPISWTNNLGAVQRLEATERRTFETLVQDLFKTDHETKVKWVCQALEDYNKVQIESGMQKQWVSLNYVSGCKAGLFGAFGLIGLDVKGDVLAFLGNKDGSARNCCLGWLFLDQEHDEHTTDEYGRVTLKDMIIDANFGYSRYTKKFKKHILSYRSEL